MSVKKVEIQCRLAVIGDKWEIILMNRSQIIKECFEKFFIDNSNPEIYLEGVLSEKIVYKTNDQLGYYFAGVLPTIMNALIEQGYEGINEKVTDDFLRKKFLTVAVPNKITGEILEFTRSLSGLFKDEMSKYMEECIRFCQVDLKTPVPPPTTKV